MGTYTVSDRFIQEFDNCLRVVTGTAKAKRPRPMPSKVMAEVELDAAQKKHAAGLMRVNHVGEICAQALYQAQKMTASSSDVKTMFAHAASEEIDHLDWTAQRLKELDARPSVLNPLWYAGALATGCVAGCFGDRFNLGFMAETERQVEQHLASHLEQLPATDMRSRAIVEQMRADEMAHGRAAAEAGGVELPSPVKALMAAMSNVMKRTAYYF